MGDIARLPYDLWHVIFQLVCTDGGRAGCVLAQTSKSVRALSASARFHSLALSSVVQVKHFLICLERIRRFDHGAPSDSSSTLGIAGAGANTPPIHNLVLAFLPGTCDAPQRAFRKWTDYARDERSLVFQLANDHRTWAAAKTAWNRAFVLHVSRLLQLAAPTLRALAVLQSPEIRLPLVPYRLPALRELTLLGDDRMFLRLPGPGALVPGQSDPSDFEFYSVPVPAEPPDDPPFPALTHLHVVFTGPKLHPWDKTLPRWAAIAPAATHLRISQGNARVPAVLGEMLGVLPPAVSPTEEADPDPEATVVHGPQPAEELSLYVSLRVVIVQMSGARKTDATLVILRNRAYMPGYWESRLRWEWRERMGGGGGCWTEDEADEDVWKVFSLEKQPGAGKRRKGKSEITVNVRELRDGSSDSQTTPDARPGKKWWRALANGIPRVRKRAVV
ncbi:hypothetical protein K466DRAFT_340410 [Polyporus arcularius HHB13444]|uniref:F-box domain-containing protein n=1 Tax=Polyporus arcularius HHB13444 TaxID=1314778 RepID=A0A5C3NVJ0_9APHY|nr:hypothetical protein K466DRAFT_340410 [Polyporus arcularius HHB13444]